MKNRVLTDIKSDGTLEIRSAQYESVGLPASWKITKFDDVATVTDYVANGSFASLKENVKYREEPSYAILVRFTDHVKKWNGNYVYVDKEAYDFLRKSSLEPGDVVIANVGDPGRGFRVPNLGRPITLGPNSVLVKGRNGVENGFLFFFFMSPWGQDLIARITTGTAQKKFNKTGLRATYLPVAPPDEQKLIVAEIEKQFSRLDEAVANLKRVKANLKRYKATVLKAAVEGRLVETEAELARREGRDYETGEKLLKRILETRRSQWKGKGKYKEPAAPDTGNLPELPEGWVWATVEALSMKVADGVHKKPNYVGEGVPFVTVKNLTAGVGISFENLNYVTQEDHEEFCKRTKPQRGDILISKDGTLGVVRLVETDRPFSVFVSVALVKPVRYDMSRYIVTAFESPVVQRQMVPKGSGLQHIHLEDLRADCIPIPPLAEQNRIVAEVGHRFSLVSVIETQISANLLRADRMRQAVLMKVFSGKM